MFYRHWWYNSFIHATSHLPVSALFQASTISLPSVKKHLPLSLTPKHHLKSFVFSHLPGMSIPLRAFLFTDSTPQHFHTDHNANCNTYMQYMFWAIFWERNGFLSTAPRALTVHALDTSNACSWLVVHSLCYLKQTNKSVQLGGTKEQT